MPQTQVQLNAKKFISFGDYPLPAPFLGLYLDVPSEMVPEGGWAIQNGFHYYQGRLMCYPGWRPWQTPGITSFGLVSTPANSITGGITLSSGPTLSNFTFETFFFVGDSQNNFIFSAFQDLNNHILCQIFDNSGIPELSFTLVVAGNSQTFTFTPGSFNFTIPHYMAFQVSGTTASIWLDGVSVASGSLVGAPSFIPKAISYDLSTTGIILETQWTRFSKVARNTISFTPSIANIIVDANTLALWSMQDQNTNQITDLVNAYTLTDDGPPALFVYGVWPGSIPAVNLSIANAPTYLYDFVKQDQTRFFILGDKNNLYLYNRTTNGVTADPPNTITKLNGSSFAGTQSERWQSTVINNQLVLTTLNIAQTQVFVDDATPLAGLGGGSPDGAQPTGARYILNCVNRLIMCYTKEGGTVFPQRVRWSDINNPTVWTPNAGVNEAGFIDLDDETGDIRGAANIGPNQFVVYTENNTYLFTYVGLPTIWQVSNKVITDVGVLGSYSLIEKENSHYFFGLEGFYNVSSSITEARIGVDRVDAFYFNTFQLNLPYNIYSYAHPIYPEIWFIYQGRNDTFFNTALIYNWEQDCWTQRTPFPFSAIGDILLASGRPLSSINTPGSTTLTWAQKAGSGSLVAITGDINGNLFIHDGTDQNANGVPLLRQLRSGDLTLGDRGNNSRLSRLFWGLTDIDLSTQQVTSTILSKTNPSDTFELQDQFVLDSDARHDLRLVDKILQIGLDTFATPSLTDIVIRAQPAGTRA